MKKPLAISVAIVILLLAVAVWVYLFIFGTPENSNEVFTDLGFDIVRQDTDVVPYEEPAIEQTLVDITGVPLRQLTVRPVAGFIPLEKNEVPFVRYMERGTGHVYDINLATGEETRVSNTTNSRVVTAVFGTGGEYVAFQSEIGYERTTSIGYIAESENSMSIASLPPNAENLTFTGTSSLNYTLTTNGTTGYRYNAISDTQAETFEVPFLSVNTHFSGDATYVSNRHAPELQGTLYRVNGNEFARILTQHFGFSSLVSPQWVAYTLMRNDTYYSEILRLSTGEVLTLPLPFIPEKCTFSTVSASNLWCAAPATEIPHTYLKSWYQGIVRSNDLLWQIDITEETATLLSDPVSQVGREIDVTSMTVNEEGAFLFFVNKNDDTLWQYDLLAL